MDKTPCRIDHAEIKVNVPAVGGEAEQLGPDVGAHRFAVADKGVPRPRRPLVGADCEQWSRCVLGSVHGDLRVALRVPFDACVRKQTPTETTSIGRSSTELTRQGNNSFSIQRACKAD